MAPPGAGGDCPIDRVVTVDMYEDTPDLFGWTEPPEHPEDHVPICMFVSQWNTSIRFSAGSANFVWLDEASTRK